MSIMNVQRKNFQAGTYAPGAPAEFLKPFAEQLTDLTAAELRTPVNLQGIAPKVAQVSPLIQAAQQRTAQQAGLGTLQFSPTTGAVTGVAEGTGVAAYEPYLQAAETAAQPGSYTTYMSPYQQEVLDTTEQLLREQRATGRAQLAQNAVTQGAFGQGRGQIAEAEYERQRDIYDAATLAGLRQEGLERAQTLQQQALTNQLALGEAQDVFSRGIASQLGATGAGAQQYSQSILDAIRQGNVLGTEYPFQRIQQATNIFGGIAQGVPSTFPTGPITTNPALTAAQTFASLYGGLGGGQQGQGITSLRSIYQ